MPTARTLLAAAGLAAAATVTGLLAVAAPAGATTPTVSRAPSAAAAACDRGPWADRVQGAPHGFTSGVRGGDYLWHDTTGFHLRVTHRTNDRAVLSGVITSPTAMRIDPVRLEHGDVAKLSANHRSLVFVFANYGHIDGVNFHTDCAASITVSHLNIGSAKLPTDRVYLGATKAHPAHIPFTVHRIHA
jgi:hypothetical protein